MHLKNKSTLRTLALADKAVKLARELAPEVDRYWRDLERRVGTPETEKMDFGASCQRIGELVLGLQGQLVLAAIAAEFGAGRPALDRSVLRLQHRLTEWLRRLRDLFRLCRLEEAADSISPRCSYFRRIFGLAYADQDRPRAGELLEALAGLDPKDLLEARLGMLAIANFPNRPASLQQQRRKKRRRRRSGPGAPSASFRRNRGGDDEDDF